MVLTTKSDILDRVKIKEIDAPATVEEIRFDGLRINYLLEYWWEGNIKSVVLYENELEAIR